MDIIDSLTVSRLHSAALRALEFDGFTGVVDGLDCVAQLRRITCRKGISTSKISAHVLTPFQVVPVRLKSSDEHMWIVIRPNIHGMRS